MQDSSTSADGAGENVTSNAGEKPSHTAEPGADAKYASSTDDASDANKSQEAAAKEGEDDEEDEAAYPTGTGLLFLCIALVVSVFIVALSNTIIATAVPTITSAFNSYKDIGWYSAGELITATAFQLPFGRAYSLLSTKWLFFSSMGIYLVGSAICGAAPGSVALIVGRAIAGIGNAGVLGGAYIIIAKNVPLRKRAIYTGLIGAAFAVASVLGPIIGGAFTTNVSWRWCFYFNLPIGAVAMLVTIFVLPSNIGRTSKELKTLKWWQVINRFDPFGVVVLLGAITSLILALQWGGAVYPWNSPRVIAVFIVFGVLMIIWTILQWYQGDEATMPFSIITQRTVWSSVCYTLLLGASFGVLVAYLPIWFQSVVGDDAETSGLKNLPLVVSVTIGVMVAGGLVVATGYYIPFLYMGTILGSVGAGLLYTIDRDTSLAKLIGYQILFGTGIGVSLQQANIAVQTVLPDKMIPAGNSLVLFARLLGTSLAAPIAQSVLQQTLSKRLGNEVAGTIFGQGGATTAAGKLRDIFGNETPAFFQALDGLNEAVTKTFLVALILAALTTPFALTTEWKSVKKEKRDTENKRERKQDEKTNDEGVVKTEGKETAAV